MIIHAFEQKKIMQTQKKARAQALASGFQKLEAEP